MLERHDWPSNVRQLQNVVASLVVRGTQRGVVGSDGLQSALGTAAQESQTLSQARTFLERNFVRVAMVRAGGWRGKAALALGLSRQGLSKLLKRFDIEDTPSGLSRTSR